MKLDIDIAAQLILSESIANSKGLDAAIQDAIKKMDIEFYDWIYIPESWDNMELFETYDNTNTSEGYTIDGKRIVIAREETPNKKLKSLLKTVED